MNMHPRRPERDPMREFRRLRIWLAALLISNVLVAVFNVAVQVQKVCP